MHVLDYKKTTQNVSNISIQTAIGSGIESTVHCASIPAFGLPSLARSSTFHATRFTAQLKPVHQAGLDISLTCKQHG
jgi:hypothetical protein